ncbi:MAG TPA: carboxypeptidase-like regulatory domain-containing protein [Polyangiaceae bacterium]
MVRRFHTFCSLVAALLVALAAAAEPTIRVRGEARIEAAAARTEGRLLVAGTVVDDTGRPVPNAHIGLAGMSAEGKVVALPPGEPCPGPTPSRVAAGSELRLTSDRLGRFCAAVTDATATTIAIVFEDPRGLLDRVTRNVTVDASRRAVELRFVSAAPALDLERESHRLEVGARSPSPLAESGTPVPLALFTLGPRGEELVAQGSSSLGGSAFFDLPSARIAGPGPLELAVRFAGSESLQPAEARVRLLATTRVRLALSRTPPSADPSEGIELDVAVGSPNGAVSGGSVEALLGGRSVGIAPVERGSAHLVARFPRQGRSATLELVYLPNEPWWLASETLKVTVALSPRSLWSSLGWLALFALLALWLLRGWRRPPRTVRADASTGAQPSAPAAALVVVERDESLRGWQGVVRDAHDGTPVPNAVISLSSAAPEERVLARTTADASGQFELGAVPGSDLTFAVGGVWHADLVTPAPPLGRLRVDLVSRRRHLLARFVRWAERRGPLGRGLGEPTPADVAQQARRAKRDDVAEWAQAVEVAAFGADAVDDGVEREVLRREPADPAAAHPPPVKRAH